MASFAERGVRSVFVYTQEAHPGERRPYHRSLRDKRSAALRMVRELGLQRQMLVDDLAGSVHRAYGGLPNMTWLISRKGRVIYKADWTDARTIAPALEQLCYEAENPAPDGVLWRPYQLQWAPSRRLDRAAFMAGLTSSGPSAVQEFIDATRACQGEAAARALESLR